ncbi:MAG: class I SAM-dependent RNA methyltransferase, partial [Clostridiales bacterium]|nr:class I SAM-dependent RNA methyltransferase [Clostridiales bacterium]
ARSVPWEIWIGKDDAFPVTGYSIDSTLFSVRDCQAVIKKAVVEHMKQIYKIEWFDETGPVHRIQFSVMKDRVSLLIDTSGNGLHKRGYRAQSNSAPIKETIAASLCALSHLKPYHKFYDPLCGSGTILIEGAMMAKNIAPGINRSFSAERFEFINRDVWRRERERAKELERVPNDFFAFGSDIDNAALNIARENAVKAGVDDIISFTLEDVRNFHPSSERGTLITNPPYGERMSSIEECKKLYESMGKVFEKKRGWSYSIITPDEEFEESFGRKADKTRKLYNGMIKCRLFMFYK